MTPAIQERVLQVIFDGIDAANQVLPREARLPKAEQTVLMGAAGGLDSLGMVNLIVAIEQKIEEEFGVTLNLADDGAMSLTDNPFATVASLAGHVAGLLERQGA